MVLSITGGLIALDAAYFKTGALAHPVILSLVAIAPAILGYFIQIIAKGSKKTQTVRDIMTAQSVLFGVIFAAILVINLIETVSFTLVFMTLPAFVLSIYALLARDNPQRGTIMRGAMILLFVGFIGDFLFYVERLVPHAADADKLTGYASAIWTGRFAETLLALAAMFISLRVSREIQATTKEYRPSFLLVIFAYSTLVLAVNYFIVLAFNQVGVSTAEVGGPRAVATTLWWITVACTMLVIGVQKGYLYRSEKLLGLLFLAITIAKVLFYDLATMGTDKKIMVLMVVGGLLLAVSYFFHTKNLLARDPAELKNL